jgi:hypothetical protein
VSYCTIWSLRRAGTSSVWHWTIWTVSNSPPASYSSCHILVVSLLGAFQLGCIYVKRKFCEKKYLNITSFFFFVSLHASRLGRRRWITCSEETVEVQPKPLPKKGLDSDGYLPGPSAHGLDADSV